MVNKNIKCILAVARSEYVKWISNPRIIIIGVLLIFMHTLAVEPLLERADKIGLPLDILEPFAAIGNSGMLVMLMPCVFLLLISDYPKMTGNTLFFVQRTGRWNWFVGQIVFMIYAIITFLIAILIGSVLISKGDITGTWSDVITKYDAKFPNEAGSFTSQLIPSNLYNQITLPSAIIHTIILMAGIYVLACYGNLFFQTYPYSVIWTFAAVFVVATGVITCSLKSETMWAFPMANTIVWLHYDEILKEPNFPVWCSYLYFGIAIMVVVILNIIAIKRLEFLNIEMVE